MKNVPEVLRSSVDPQKMSLTIKGILLGLVPLAILITARLGYNLVENDLLLLIDSSIALLSAFFVVCGLIRKIVVKLKK